MLSTVERSSQRSAYVESHYTHPRRPGPLVSGSRTVKWGQSDVLCGGVDGGESIRDYICQNFGFSSTYLRRAYAELWIVL